MTKTNKEIGLDKDIYSRPSEWVKDVLAMVAGRIIYAGSKVSLCNQYNNTSLWELLGHNGRPDVEKHCYFPLDKLLNRQDVIQKNLSKKHLSNSNLVLYDITSSYFEGEYKDSKIVGFGYNRDKKKGHEQIVIGLICTPEGCPIAIEVYPSGHYPGKVTKKHPVRLGISSNPGFYRVSFCSHAKNIDSQYKTEHYYFMVFIRYLILQNCSFYNSNWLHANITASIYGVIVHSATKFGNI